MSVNRLDLYTIFKMICTHRNCVTENLYRFAEITISDEREGLLSNSVEIM